MEYTWTLSSNVMLYYNYDHNLFYLLTYLLALYQTAVPHCSRLTKHTRHVLL
jgi:hypothetical protein